MWNVFAFFPHSSVSVNVLQESKEVHRECNENYFTINDWLINSFLFTITNSGQYSLRESITDIHIKQIVFCYDFRPDKLSIISRKRYVWRKKWIHLCFDLRKYCLLHTALNQSVSSIFNGKAEVHDFLILRVYELILDKHAYTSQKWEPFIYKYLFLRI